MKRWRLAALGAVLVLVGLEAGLRWGVGLGEPPLVVRDPDVEYRLIPSKRYHRFGNLIDINSHGMRGPEHPVAPAPDERRVLLVGDSVIYGNHHLDQSDTIAVRMTSEMAEDGRLPGCRPLVMAAAASSWGPVNQAAFLADTGLLGADLGMLVVSAHDLHDVPAQEDLIPYRLDPSWSALHDAWRMVAERLARRLAEPGPAMALETGRNRTLAALDRMHAQFAEANVPLILVYHPTMTERAHGARQEKDDFRDWAESNAIAFHDIADLDLPESSYRDDIHPKAGGAEVIASGLTSWAETHLRPCS